VLPPRHAPWLDEFRSELLQFPHGRFDDRVDSLSQFLSWVANRLPAIHNIVLSDLWRPSPTGLTRSAQSSAERSSDGSRLSKPPNEVRIYASSYNEVRTPMDCEIHCEAQLHHLLHRVARLHLRNQKVAVWIW
jgi:hypothetical protein